ncbi:Sodium:dicarboxylate symporter [uncultured Alphaproteobacteria bacterium]|uniref:Sodium:dicarboxylate symporter n=1 Tax=uncultured Alphaproteobacteria bacterium TaxID=91750 RepID=A0A212JBI1_9PROT|nr:Sodium:dicarboxylate symporter [uncultured Alphaproteobacteria bacterium]
MTQDRKPGLLGRWNAIPLWQKILAGLVLGLIVGLAFGPAAGKLKPIGTAFISGIKMLIVPLVFVSLVSGVTSMRDPAKMGRVGIKTIALYLVTTAVAIAIGLGLGTALQPGAGVGMEAAKAVAPKAAPSLIDTLVALIPTNPIEAMSSGNVLQVIVFAILLGLAINMSGAAGEKVRDGFDALAQVIYKLTAIVIWFAPFGVFALMAWTAGTYGLDLLLPLGMVIVAVYIGCLIHAFVVYGGAIWAMGLNPLLFFKGIAEAAAVAFTTTSSSGTLPVTMTCTRKNLGVSQGVSGFVLPLGATINMDGTALYQGVCALFVAQVFGVSLSGGDYLMIILTATLASIGTAGVPGAGLIMLSLVLSTVGLPLEGVAIIAGIDRVLDMARTSLNVVGDAMVATLVAKSEGELNQEIYTAGRDVVGELEEV